VKNLHIRKLIISAVMTALITAATAVLIVPIPAGYVHLGDGLVLLAGWLLGPVWGAVAAGLGSALADLFLGFAVYVPGTFVVKALCAAVCAFLVGWLGKAVRNPFLPLCVGSIAAELVMAGGYFLYESLILGVGAAAVASVPGNLTQGASGVVVFCLLSSLLQKRRIPDRLWKKR